jgi:hypothetical protein
MSAGVHALSADELRMLFAHAIGRVGDHPRVAPVDSAVTVQIRHSAPAVVVDEDVGRVAVHVPLCSARPRRGTAICVVPRRPEAAHDRHVLHRDAFSLKLLPHQLELVDQLVVEHQILRPNVGLIECEKVAKPEVLRDRSVHVRLRDFDESLGIGVRGRPDRVPLRGPEPKTVRTQLHSALLRERMHRDERGGAREARWIPGRVGLESPNIAANAGAAGVATAGQRRANRLPLSPRSASAKREWPGRGRRGVAARGRRAF